MTQEEKARAFDEALDRCKEWASGTCGHSVADSPKDIAEFIFPELKESEDERIRESLIEFLTEIKDISESGRTSWAVRKEDAEMCKSFIDYLEKQKEQSITANDLDEEIHRFFDDCIEVHDAKVYGVDERVITVDCYEITARHFAKWGEKQKEQKPINHNLTTWHRDVVYCAMCDKNLDEGLRCNLEVVYKTIKELVDRTPVVEEQKPAEWSDEDADMLNCCISSIEEAKENRYAYKETNGDTSYDREIDWLKSLRPQSKQEWSEEDERILKGIIGLIDHDQHYGVSNNEMISWLKTLRPQLKQKWSEEDKKMLWIIQLALTKHPITDKQEKDAFDWLNSLRPQPHTVSIKNATKFGNLEYERGVKDGIQSEKSRQWKPSEEQMDALRASNSYWLGTSNEVPRTDLLESLYNDLEKLIAKR